MSVLRKQLYEEKTANTTSRCAAMLVPLPAEGLTHLACGSDFAHEYAYCWGLIGVGPPPSPLTRPNNGKSPE